MRSTVVASSLAVLLCVVALASAANPTGPFWVQAFYNADGCAMASSTSFAAYPSGVCVQSQSGSLAYDCSDMSNPARMDYSSNDCSGAATTTRNLNSTCAPSQTLWFTAGCVADLSTLFYGNALSFNGYKNATECSNNNGPVVSYTVSTASTGCTPISNAGNVVAYTSSCNSTHSETLYCYDSACANCYVVASTPLNQTCSDTDSKQFCISGTVRPAAPVAAAPVAAAPVASSTPVATTAPVSTAPKAASTPVVKAPSSASSLLVSAMLIIAGCAVVLFA
eukprot:TRINITY_DN13246_c0_g1_i1.p1 TRINITY_DN13246_c0_g1~~TRINITY_DN13246_c0_g1_i1.p1  ORF type:complete len:280 (-),score=62.04 TRINITY_DN13246_c0_g1_i1:69-908(-)